MQIKPDLDAKISINSINLIGNTKISLNNGFFFLIFNKKTIYRGLALFKVFFEDPPFANKYDIKYFCEYLKYY